MTTLITGGAGYLGSVLALDLLRKGRRVRVLDSLMYGDTSLTSLLGQDHFEFVRGDVREQKVVEGALDGVENIVHLAAIVGDPACARQPQSAEVINQEASLGLYEAARRSGTKKFVFASTCSNYGKMADLRTLANEETELRPVSLYAETKVAVERVLLSEAKETEPNVTVLRFATLYGSSPRMRFDLTVNQFTAEMLVKKHLVVFGEQFWRPYTHVRDAAKAIRLVLDAQSDKVAGRVFNVGDTRENYRKLDLVEMIRGQVRDARVEFVRRDEDPRDYRVSFERIKTELGFAINNRVPDGIDEIASAFGKGLYGDFENDAYHNAAPV